MAINSNVGAEAAISVVLSITLLFSLIYVTETSQNCQNNSMAVMPHKAFTSISPSMMTR